MSPHRLRLVGALLSLPVLLAAAPGVPREGTDPYFGDSGTSAFYRWSGALARPGRMLREEPVGDGFYADNASVARRILYSSTDGRFGRGVVEASGLLYLPKGKPPPGGWPLVVWGHGTFGIADVCAPSWKKPTERDGTYADAWVRAGFAVVAPDYQGLGTRGVHPYLLRKPEGYSVLDAARAAIAAYPGQIANKVILTGQSQGSGAVLNAAAVARAYAPDVNLRGVIATALVWRESSRADPEGDFAQPDSARYLIMRMYAGGLEPHSLRSDDLVTEKGVLLREAARKGCSRDLVPVARDMGVTGLNAFNRAPGELAASLPWPAVPAKRIGTPLFIATGLADRTIPTDRQYAAVRALCRAGNSLSWRKYAGVSHSATSHAALQDAIGFARHRLAGEAAKSECGLLTPPGPIQAQDPSVPFGD